MIDSEWAVDGQCINMATDVMRHQRQKGIEKYNSTLEDNADYGLIGMTRMAQEEMADGSVYLAKLQLMLAQLKSHADAGDIDAIRGMLK